MILILSDAYIELKEEDGALFSSSVSGYGFKAAKALSKMGTFPALFCPLGCDRAGSRIVEELVSNAILFDPDLARLLGNTAIKIEYKDGSRTSFFRSSVSACLDSANLGEAINLNTNIKALLISSNMLSINPTARSIIDQSLFINPRPFIVLDLSEKEEGAVLEASLALIKDDAHLIIMREERLFSDLLDKKAVIVKNENGFKFYKEGKEVLGVEKKLSEDEEFAASLLFYLESSHFLPSELEDFSSYDISKEIILDFCKTL